MTQTVDLVFDIASTADAAALAAMRTRVAQELTVRHGHGHWSYVVSERGVRRDIGTSKVLVARKGRILVGTLRLVAKKPWAIDPAYFTAVSTLARSRSRVAAPVSTGSDSRSTRSASRTSG